MDDPKKNELTRRDFLKMSTVASVGITVAGSTTISRCAREVQGSVGPLKVSPLPVVRVGVVGVGNQGASHVKSLLVMDGVELQAVCDPVEKKVNAMQALAQAAGKAIPIGYSRGENDFKRMCAQEELDLVVTATPWDWHVPVCVEAMRTGSHAATEVPAAVTVEGCWELVETAEKFQKHCVMLENVCYMRAEMMILHMVRKGLFGELLHGEGAYNHDLRHHKLGGVYEQDWRVYHSMKRNGNLYPTHGLGPIAQCMNVNRGDRFDYLVSMSSPSKGLQEYVNKNLGQEHKFAKAQYKLGDVNSTLIKTVNGKTIHLVHDTNLPRPYSRINLVQGTHAITQGFGDLTHSNLIYVEGRSPAEKWEPLINYANEFEHPYYEAHKKKAAPFAHEGADFLELFRLIECLQQGLPTDMDVYDAADWTVVSGLTELSVANRSRPVDFPDFTRGLWKTRTPLEIISAM